jgi:autotransporter-associated beta strand protein
MKKFQSRALFLAAGTLVAASSASATAVTWGAGPTGDWATAAGWVGGVAPVSGDNLIFDGTVAKTLTDTLTTSAFSITGITFNGTGAYTISGNAFLLNGGISTTAASGTQTINNAITLGATQTVTTSTGTTIALGGIISGTGFGLTKEGSGTLTLNGANTYDGGTSINAGTVVVGTNNAALGAGSVTISSGGILTVSSGRSLANAIANAGTINTSAAGATFSTAITGAGVLNINNTGAGKTAFSATSGTYMSGGTINISSGATLYDFGTGHTVAANINIAGTGNNENRGAIRFAGANNFTGNMNLTGSTTLGWEATANIQGGVSTNTAGLKTLTLGTTAASTGAFTVSGAITDGSGQLALTKLSTGTVTLSGVNTYTGNTTVSAGAITLADNGAFSFVIGASGVNNAISGGGTLTLNGDLIFNLTGAGTTLGDSWQIVNNGTLTETYGATFSVTGATDLLNNKWAINNGGITYTFDEGTGALSVTAVPEPSTYGLIGAGALAAVAFVRRRRKLAGNVA